MNTHVVSQGSDLLELKSTSLASYDLIDLSKDPEYKFIPGDRYLVIGRESYDHITKVSGIHLGLRNEGYYDCTRMQFLRTRGGIIFKFSDLEYETVGEWLDESSYNGLKLKFDSVKKKVKGATLKSGVSQRTGKPWYRFEFKRPKDTDKFKEFLNPQIELPKEPKLRSSKIIRDSELIDKAFDYYDNYEGYIGLDYETGGIPFDDPDFEVMGVGIASLEGIAAYFDIEYMIHVGGNYDHFKSRYLRFLRRRHNQIYTYNVGFELRVTYLMFGEFFNFHDAASINYIDGNNYRRFSLKYTALNYLHVASWDDDFDYLCWNLGLMMNGYKDKKSYVPPTPKESYESCSYWVEISTKYPSEIDEFKRLFDQSWGNPYKCIPSNILGSYCNLDAFYTALLRKASDDLGYSELCWDTFCDNIRMAAQLNISGFHQDTEFKDNFARKAYHYMIYGQYNAVVFYLYKKLQRFDLSEYSLDNNLINLLKTGVDIFNSKSIISRYLDDSYDSGLNESSMVSELGTDMSSEIMGFIRKRYSRVDRSILRKRNIFNELDSLILDKFNFKRVTGGYLTSDGKKISNIDYNDVRDYYTTLNIFKKLREIKINDKDINDIFIYDGKSLTPSQFLEFLKSILNLSSPVPYDIFIRNIFLSDPYLFMYCHSAHLTKTKYESGVVTRRFEELILSDTQKEVYEEEKSEFDGIFSPIMNIIKFNKDELINHELISDRLYSQYTRSGELSTLFHEISVNYSNKYSSKKDERPSPPLDEHVDMIIKNLLSLVSELYGLIKRKYKTIVSAGTHFYMGIKWNNDDLNLMKYDDGSINCTDRRICDYWKLAYGIRLYRKYNKNYGTYLTGILCENQTTCNPPDRLGVSTKRYYKGEDKIIKCYPTFHEMQARSKRWSAGIHTIPPKDESKKIIRAPKGSLISYFDINAAEIRTISYASGDPEMIKQWESGNDLYIEACKLVYPNLPEEEIKNYWRGVFKVVLLGKMYMMSDDTLAAQAECSLEEARDASERLFSLYKVAKEWRDNKSKYAMDHNGKIDTILGDKLIIRDVAKKDLSTRGINTCVQGFTSLALIRGFYQCVRAGIESDGYFVIRPITAVHDSCTNEFNIDRLFEIGQFYYKNMTEYLYDKFKIRYKFKTFVGKNYYDVAELDPIEEGRLIGLSGSATSLNYILQELDNSNISYKLVEGCRSELIPERPMSLFDAFYGRAGQCVYEQDYSFYSIKLEKIKNQ